MAGRPRRTMQEQLDYTLDQIAKTKEQLDKLLQQKELLELKIKEEELISISDLMKESGMTIADIRNMIEEKMMTSVYTEG